MKKGKVFFYANAAAAYASGQYSGINRVTYELLKSLAEEKDLPFELEIYTQGLKSRKNILKGFGLRHHHLFTPNNSILPSIYEYLPIREILCKYDLFHIPHNFDYCFNPEKTVVTLHDMLMFKRKRDFSKAKFDEAIKKLPRLLNRSKCIITCSESSKTDIVNHLGINPTKIIVIPWGVRHEVFFSNQRGIINNKILQNLNIDYPFFLSVSCGTDRKNTFILIKAFLEFSKQSPNNHLVLVWPNVPREISEFIKTNHLEKYVHFIDYVDDSVLAILYNETTAFLFPSKYEGFGLPVLESLACGTPVVLGTNSSLPEVAGNAGIYIQDIDNPKEWEIIMTKFENGYTGLEEMIDKGITHAKKFTWKNNVRITIDCYKSVL